VFPGLRVIVRNLLFARHDSVLPNAACSIDAVEVNCLHPCRSFPGASSFFSLVTHRGPRAPHPFRRFTNVDPAQLRLFALLVLATIPLTIPPPAQGAKPAGLGDGPYNYDDHDYHFKTINGNVRMTYKNGRSVGFVGIGGEINSPGGGDTSELAKAVAAYQQGTQCAAPAGDATAAASLAQPANSGGPVAAADQPPAVSFSLAGDATVQDKGLGPVQSSPDGTTISFASPKSAFELTSSPPKSQEPG
jgi:hypothetical protein